MVHMSKIVFFVRFIGILEIVWYCHPSVNICFKHKWYLWNFLSNIHTKIKRYNIFNKFIKFRNWTTYVNCSMCMYFQNKGIIEIRYFCLRKSYNSVSKFFLYPWFLQGSLSQQGKSNLETQGDWNSALFCTWNWSSIYKYILHNKDTSFCSASR